MSNIYSDIPESERVLNKDTWRDSAYLRQVALRARTTNFGLKEPERHVASVLKLLSDAEEAIDDLYRQVKGLQLENGRLKKKAGKAHEEESE